MNREIISTRRDDRPTGGALLIRLGPAALVMAAIFVLSSRSTLPRPESISAELFSIAGHLGAYFALFIALWWALGLVSVPSRQRLLLAFAGAVLYGLSDEWHQSFVPGRTPDARDLVTDAIGAAAGLWLVSKARARLDARDPRA